MNETSSSHRLPDGIDGSRVDLAEEFRRCPFGRHSPDLAVLLNYMRARPIVGKHFLLMTESNSRWMLARFTEGSGRSPLGVERLPEQTFDHFINAEWVVFKLRWAELFGAELPKDLDGEHSSEPGGEGAQGSGGAAGGSAAGSEGAGFGTSHRSEPKAGSGAAAPIGERPAVLAYSNRQSLRAGESIEFKVSSVGAETYQADIVRLRSPDVGRGPHTPEFREVPLGTPMCGEHRARQQPIYPGSYVSVPSWGEIESPDGFSLLAGVFPTRLASSRQCLIGTYAEGDHRGVALFIESDGRLGCMLGTDDRAEVVHSDILVPEGRWTWVALTAATDGALCFHAFSRPSHRLEAPLARSVERRPAVEAAPGSGPVWIGARRAVSPNGGEHPVECFNGRIERPRLVGRPMLSEEIASLVEAGPAAGVEGVLADWDFSLGIDGECVTDVSGNARHGSTQNLPTRGVGGSNWSGRTVDWQMAPQEYGAIHFHEDDLADAGWETSHSLAVPEDWPSGCYAGRFRAADAEFYVPFMVRPPVDGATADVVFLVPTATYAAYVNLTLRVTSPWNELIHGRLTVLDETDLLMLRFPEIGLSTYDSHSDGSTVEISSMHRPITNFRPKGRIYKFCQDLLIVDWLEREGVRFDVLCDDDLDREGADALAPYRVLVTSSHPEYISTRIMDGVEAFVRSGGRLMNLGGNTYWHRIAYHTRMPGIVEVRRPDLPRLWRADVSGGHHTFGGEAAGTWSGLGRAPHTIGGVGFITQGFDECSYYRRTPDSHDERAAFVFNGIDEDVIGDFGMLMGGAAGYEIERADAGLGTPAHALVLASSERHSNLYELMVTSIGDLLPVTDPGDPDRIRADMVFFETPGGGAVFSVGSIAWSGSLPYNGYDNNVARLTANVLRRFRRAEPFMMPDGGD